MAVGRFEEVNPPPLPHVILASPARAVFCVISELIGHVSQHNASYQTLWKWPEKGGCG
jgi:hypothetical protein